MLRRRNPGFLIDVHGAILTAQRLAGENVNIGEGAIRKNRNSFLPNERVIVDPPEVGTVWLRISVDAIAGDWLQGAAIFPFMLFSMAVGKDEISCAIVSAAGKFIKGATFRAPNHKVTIVDAVFMLIKKEENLGRPCDGEVG